MADTASNPLTDLAQQILKDGVIDADEVQRLRTLLYADGRIERAEADMLFQLNDETSGQDNHASWGEFFVEALSDFVLKDEDSPGVVSDEEAAYLISHIQGDGRVDANELALLVKIVTESTSCPQSLNDFVLQQLRAAVVQDGKIDADEVQMITKVIFGTGGDEGASVSRAEADFLAGLNQATQGAANHASWQTLLVRALASHLLDDPKSPGVIDEPEAQWLLKWLDAEQPLGENLQALLKNLRAKANSLPAQLQQHLS